VERGLRRIYDQFERAGPPRQHGSSGFVIL
jgi:hypothetical protein